MHDSFNRLATHFFAGEFCSSDFTTLKKICCIAALPALYSVANVHRHRSLTDCMDVPTDKLDSEAHSRPPTRHGR